MNQPEEGNSDDTVGVGDDNKVTLNKRMEAVALGCFLIMLGGFMFVPQ